MHTAAERQRIESDHSSNQARGRDIGYDSLDMLLLGAQRAYTEARIEDPYKRGKFVEGFVYVRALAAFLHEDVVGRLESKGEQMVLAL